MPMEFHGAHLSYCMNVHPARDLPQVLANIRDYTVPVRRQLCPEAPFGLGIWLPEQAVRDVRAEISLLRALLDEENLYLFTINGFPYGVFHGARVKQNVYYPDWSEEARVTYTTDLIDILAEFLPDDVEGSVSTVPVTYGKELPVAAMTNLLRVAEYARTTREQTGRRIWIALEPEPDCYLENTAETIAFFDDLRKLDGGVTEVIGVCFDTCHLCLQGENLAVSLRRLLENGIQIPKVQISAALRFENDGGRSARECLGAYDEPVYLHQTRVFPNGEDAVLGFKDLGDALAANPIGTWLIHFHVPLPFDGQGQVSSTNMEISAEFLDLVLQQTPNIEIETYTFDVLPLPKPGIVESIVGEFRWLESRLSAC